MKTQNIKLKERRTHPALMFLTALTAAAAVLPSTVLAYGPERATFTMAEPADYVTFNSITDNPVLGDERNFVRIVEAGSGNNYADEVEIVPGKEYTVYIGYHNNAKSSLNTSANGGVGISIGTNLKAQYSTRVTPDQRGTVSAVISSRNANPESVWDEAYMTTKYDEVLLRYKEGSAVIHNSWGTNGSILPTTLFTEDGTYIGYNELNGVMPGCAEFSGHITYTLIAENVGAKIEKTVSLDGENFFENVQVKRGDTVTYKAVFTNTGTMNLSNVTFHDIFPEGVVLVDGTTYLYNASHEQGEKLTDLIDKNGYNTGTYGPGATATIIYKAKVNSDAPCGNQVNRMFVDHDNGEISDGATVEVVCEETPNTPKQELPNTGPAEIVLALVIVTGIGIGGAYFIRTRNQLKKLEGDAEGKN